MNRKKERACLFFFSIEVCSDENLNVCCTSYFFVVYLNLSLNFENHQYQPFPLSLLEEIIRLRPNPSVRHLQKKFSGCCLSLGKALLCISEHLIILYQLYERDAFFVKHTVPHNDILICLKQTLKEIDKHRFGC